MVIWIRRYGLFTTMFTEEIGKVRRKAAIVLKTVPLAYQKIYEMSAKAFLEDKFDKVL